MTLLRLCCADAVPASTPRVLINLTRAGERKQQQQQHCATPEPADKQQQQLPCGPMCRFRRQKAGSSGSSSPGSSDALYDSSSSSDSDSDEDCGSVTECDSVSPALTASSSVADIASCCCPPTRNSAADADTDTQPPPVAAAAAAAAPAADKQDVSSSSSDAESSPAVDAGGFDFEACVRDVLHLGDCDSAVQQLAALLGWQQELQQLVEAGDAALREAQACWED